MCGLSTRKTVTPQPTQWRTTSQQRLPEAAPVLALEVDVVDVLVALRRVLGVLQRPVGAAVEPLGMLLQPRVVGRALDREVERDLDPELLRVGDEGAELLRGAERRVDRVVPALLGADRPRAADVALRRRLGRCSGPCGSCVRSGGSAAGRSTSKPSSAKRGSSLRTPAKPPHERGKSSYHEPKRREHAVDVHRVRRRRTPSRTASPAGAASAFSTVSSSSPSSTAPSDSSLARSAWPAATLRRSSSWNEATRSTHASIRKLQQPRPVDLERAGPEVVAERLERRLAPAASRPGPCSEPLRRASRGRRERSGR